MKFEEAVEQLEDIVDVLEKSKLPMEEQIKKFEEGVHLVGFCKKTLDEAEERIKAIQDDPNVHGKTDKSL